MYCLPKGDSLWQNFKKEKLKKKLIKTCITCILCQYNMTDTYVKILIYPIQEKIVFKIGHSLRNISIGKRCHPTLLKIKIS